MCSQPAGEGDLRAVREQIHDAAPLQVQQQGAIADSDSASEGKIVDTEDFDSLDWWQRRPPDGSQHGVRNLTARSQTTANHAAQQPIACVPSEEKAAQLDQLAQTHCASCVGRHHPREPFGEDGAWAGRLVTDEAQKKRRTGRWRRTATSSHLLPG
jgi:hypothetical protein